MRRRLRAVLIGTLAIVAAGMPVTAAGSAQASELERDSLSVPIVAPAAPVAAVETASDIVPGAVGRSSPLLDATYDATLRLSWTTRKISVDSSAVIRNTSGGPIDRVELNTIT